MIRRLLIVSLLAAPLMAPALVHAQTRPARGAAPADAYDGIPPASAYQGGAGSPFSKNASNIPGTAVHSEIAPRLPNPDAAGDDTRDLLMSANRALMTNQTGAAQEALERAETRVLTRVTDPVLAKSPDADLMARGINDARLALGQRDIPRARAIVEHLLNPG